MHTMIFNDTPLCPVADSTVHQKELIWTHDSVVSLNGSEPAESSQKKVLELITYPKTQRHIRVVNIIQPPHSQDCPPQQSECENVHIDTPHTPVSNPSCGNLHKCHLLAKINNLPPPPPHPSRHLIGKTQPGGICWAWNWFAGYFHCKLLLFFLCFIYFCDGCWRWESRRGDRKQSRGIQIIYSEDAALGSGKDQRSTEQLAAAANEPPENQHLDLLWSFWPLIYIEMMV